MARRATIDLLVIGADAAGLAAAACAARRGAKTALAATGDEPAAAGRVDEPPNFVWRLLDLHHYDLRLDAPGERVTLAADGARVLSTSANAAGAAEALAARDAALGPLWRSFAERIGDSTARSAERESDPPADVFLSANDLLDDYFADEALKAHLLSAFAAPFGLAGDEAGSAAALAAAGAAPRRRTSATALAEALIAAAKKSGVDLAAGKLQSLARIDGKIWKATMDSGREIRARQAMASSALIGEAAGLNIDCAGSPLVRRLGAEATIKIRYDKRPAGEGAMRNGVYYTAENRDQLIRARNSMIDGRLDDAPPLAFEIDGKEIVARAPFSPARIREGDEEREWTGQDRQVLGRQAASIIEKRLRRVGAIREIEVTIGPDPESGLRRRTFDRAAIPAPPPSDDAIGAAARLAMELALRE